jgi:8-oxo-dGTP diphosphatase
MLNLRVYGVLVTGDNKILVSDELIRGMYITKFPGGGLEIGEGTRDCLKREFMEELNLEIDTGKHIYTTDFYQQSAFNPAHQIISIYYEAIPLGPLAVPLREHPFAFDETQMKIYEQEKETQTFRLINPEKFSEEDLTLPIDKIVARLVKESLL